MKHCLKQTYGARLAAVTDGGKGVMCSAVIQLDLLFRENVRIESFGKPGSTPAERTRQQANHQKSTHAQRRRYTGQCKYMQTAPPQHAEAAGSSSLVADAQIRALPHELLHLQHKRKNSLVEHMLHFRKVARGQLGVQYGTPRLALTVRPVQFHLECPQASAALLFGWVPAVHRSAAPFPRGCLSIARHHRHPPVCRGWGKSVTAPLATVGGLPPVQRRTLACV